MVRPIDQEITAIGNIVVTVPTRRRHRTLFRAATGSTRVGQEAEGIRGQHRQEPVLQLPGKGTSEAG